MFSERVDRFDARKAQSNSEEDSNNLYLDRLDAGLYTLQRIVLVLADVSVNGSSSCRNRAIKLFQMRTGNGKLSRHLIPVYFIFIFTFNLFCMLQYLILCIEINLKFL